MSVRPGIDVIVGGDAPPPQGRSAWFIVATSSAACIGIALASGTHLGLVFIVLPAFVAIVWQSPRTMIAILPVWMVLLGLIRRLTPGGGNITFSGDPVLIIGPIVILLLFFVAASRGAFEHRSRFATAVGALGTIAFFEAFNPKQGNLLAGLGGLLFILVPMLSFWIGRALVDEALAIQIVRTIAVLGLCSAIYGLIQEFHGLPSWDQAWVSTNGYAALTVGSGVLRAFGSFSSAEEYAAFLSISLVAWMALANKKTRIFPPAHLAATVVVAVALWYESERTAVFLVVLAIGVMLAARLRLRPLGVLAGGVGAVAVLLVFGGHFGGGGASCTSAACQLQQHNITGIADPLGSGSSLPGHLNQTMKGMLQAIKSPFGHGTGSVTLAASRFAHARTGGTEFDPGNMGIALGIFGLAAFFVVLWQAIKTAYLDAVLRHDVVSLFALGMLMAVLFQWTNGDLYSVCWLIWLFLGYLDVSVIRARAEIAARPAPPPPFTWRRPGESRPPSVGS
jgi:hypothetical protein